MDFKLLINIFYKLIKYLQKNTIIHRDFKAANVLINDGIFKICDFGFAKECLEAKTMLGSPAYMVIIIVIIILGARNIIKVSIHK